MKNSLVASLLCLSISAGLIPSAHADFDFRTTGVSLNPVGLLLLGMEGGALSAEITRFDIAPHLELGLPLVLSYYDFDEADSNATQDKRFIAYLDPRLRYFLNGSSGWFVSSHLRIGYESWEQKKVFEVEGNNASGSRTQLGLGFGGGWRLHTESGLYWGAEFSIGRNFVRSESGDQYELDNRFSFIENDEIFYDLTFMRLGWAW